MIEQGDFINRPSRIGLEVKGVPGRVEEVRVGGSSVVVTNADNERLPGRAQAERVTHSAGVDVAGLTRLTG